MKGYRTILDHFKQVKYVLLDNTESKINQIHMIENIWGANLFAPYLFLF